VVEQKNMMNAHLNLVCLMNILVRLRNVKNLFKYDKTLEFTGIKMVRSAHSSIVVSRTIDVQTGGWDTSKQYFAKTMSVYTLKYNK